MSPPVSIYTYEKLNHMLFRCTPRKVAEHRGISRNTEIQVNRKGEKDQHSSNAVN